jgi:L-fuconolactonase
MQRIDAHVHLWDPARGDYGWLDPQMTALYRRFEHTDIKPLLDAGKIEGVVLIQAAPSVAETEYLLDIADAVPWILGVVGWVDFDADDVGETIARLARNPKLVGIRPMLQDIADPMWILDRQRSVALEALESCQLVFDALVRPIHLEAIAQLAAAHPRLAIVIDHAAKPSIGASIDASWAAAMQKTAQFTNVVCKLSGLMTELKPGIGADKIEAHAQMLLATFEPDRLLWGSDWPVLTEAATYEEWLGVLQRCFSQLAADDLDAVMGGNAIRTYRLKVH